jgi:hypothetical protein
MFAKLGQVFVHSNVVFVSFKVLPKTQHKLLEVDHHHKQVGCDSKICKGSQVPQGTTNLAGD